MALVKCPDCGKEVSETAPMCIGCGRQMQVAQKVSGTTGRTGGKYELIGFLLILASTGGCSVGFISGGSNISTGFLFGIIVCGELTGCLSEDNGLRINIRLL